jgi:hypothetical protein
MNTTTSTPTRKRIISQFSLFATTHCGLQGREKIISKKISSYTLSMQKSSQHPEAPSFVSLTDFWYALGLGTFPPIL